MNFSARSDQPELMDAPDLDEATYRRCLADLASVNRTTFTHHATLKWLAAAARDLPDGAGLSIFDIGYGQGDLLRAIAAARKLRRLRLELAGVDLNPRGAEAARTIAPVSDIKFHTGDVFTFTPRPAPDFIVTSQFAHHLPDADIIRLMQWMDRHASRGWLIADLHRHWFAYHGFPLLARLKGWHEIVRHDGQISIARGFVRADWKSLAKAAGQPVQIAWKMPFRWQVSRLKPWKS